MKYRWLILLLLIPLLSLSQNGQINSLKKVLLSASDTQEVNILNEISRLYYNQKQSVNDSNLIISAGEFAGKALQLSKQINYTKGIGIALFNTGEVLSDKGDLHQAISKFNEAMPFLKEAGNNKILGDCMASLGDCIHELGNNQQAIEYYNSSLVAFRKINDTSGIIGSLEWKGHSYFDLGDYKNAYKYGQDASELVQKTRDTLAQIQTAAHLANLFLGADMPETALEYMRIITRFYPNIYKSKEISSWETQWGLLKAGEAYLQLGDTDSAMQVAQIVGFDLGDHDQDLFLGHLYYARHEYSKALPYYTDGFKISEQTDHKITLARHANELSRVYIVIKKYDSALYYANKALLTAQKIHALLEMKNAIGNLADIYDRIKDYTKAYHFTQLYKSLSDSLAPEEYKRKLALIQIQRQLENQQQQAQLLAKENQLQLQRNTFEKARARRIQIMAIIIVSATALVIAAIIMNLRLKRKKDQLQKKQLQQELELQTAESKRLEADFTVRSMELEMLALRSQMNPHFIFNCLSSINRYILINNTEAASSYLTKFSRLIRMALQHSEKSMITLEKELEMLRHYLDLERLRFKNAFDYSITFINTIDTATIFVPPLILQPFAENAIWHGLMHKKGTGHLDIALSIEGKILTGIITDNGIGRTEAALLNSKNAEKGKSMGVQITVERLALLNQTTDQKSFFDIEDIIDKEGNTSGTKVELKIQYKDMVEAFD
ncbi:MAG TPA: histidine kinase [Chitinophagaceae bacterium]|nr:histidine kinase [Chitinophagaceae bacterium]